MTDALSWFARQVPTEGFSDVNEGRVGETEIPHSDQWVNPPEKDSGKYRPDKFNLKHVLKNINKSAGITKTLIEEIYQGNEYLTNKSAHGATYENGRHVYQYPSSWQNSNSVNKMIAVRRIETKPRDFLFDFSFTVWLSGENPETDPGHIVPINVQIPAGYNIYQALSTIKTSFEREKPAELAAVVMVFSYNEAQSLVALQILRAMSWKINSASDNDQLLMLLNVPLENKQAFYATLTQTNQKRLFKNVRPRESRDIFLHASFVSNSTSGYLGRGGEFYPKPSKIYADDGQSFFYIELSFDGHSRCELPYENFILELAFITDSDNYQSP
jgi:hypothetical protein